MAGMGYAKHLETDDPAPSPPAKGVLRVYGMKFCPFVHRLKLVMAAKKIEHETIHINLSKKPKWYFGKNPGGKVPTIERDEIILYESDITSGYVDEVYPGRRLATLDPLTKARKSILLGAWGNAVAGYYGYNKESEEDRKNSKSLAKIREAFAKIEAYLQNKKLYVCGDQPGLTDFLIWPHLERIGVVAPSVIKEYSLLQSYFDRMEKDEAVIACRHSNDLHKQFIDSYVSGNTTYDIGKVE